MGTGPSDGERKERRKLILTAARRLLCHYGPHKTTIAEIAREAEIGVGTVYLEFASKEAIVESLSDLSHGEILDAMREAIAKKTARGASFGERICAAFDARLETFLARGAEGAHAKDLFHCVDPAVKTAQTRFKEAERDLLVALLKEGAAAGELVASRGETTAVALLRVYATYSPPWVFIEPADDVRRSLRAMHQVVLYGIVVR
jgi:AcrR family transcriptional regulator